MEASASSPEKIPRRWKMASIFGLLIAVTWACLLFAGNQSKPHFYVRSDGHLFIEGKRGLEINLGDLAKHLEEHRSYPSRIVIEVDSNFPVEGIGPLLNKTAELGFARYQIRSDDHKLNFSLPCCCHEGPGNSQPEFIDLRAKSTSEPPPSMMYGVTGQWADVCVAADGTILWGELLSRISPKLKSGVTMEIQAGNCALYRWKNEDKEIPDQPNPHLPKPIWTRAVDYVRGWF